MDTSPEYVKMCSKATEIQEYRPPWPPESSRPLVVSPSGDWWACAIMGEMVPIWLPRQDQLQEMMNTVFWELRRYLSGHRLDENKPYEFECLLAGKEIFEGASAEQVCLQGVMQEKYGKVWSEERQEWLTLS